MGSMANLQSLLGSGALSSSELPGLPDMPNLFGRQTGNTDRAKAGKMRGHFGSTLLNGSSGGFDGAIAHIKSLFDKG